MSSKIEKKNDMTAVHIRMPQEIKDMLVKLAEQDRRDMTQELCWIIETEWKKRQKEPH
jgi:predicted DNA-binding protein